MIADSDNTSLIQKELAAFGDVDAAYAVIEPDTGRFCGNKAAEVRQLEGEELETYRALSSRGMRYYMPLRKCLVTMYECITFDDGVPGLIQKVMTAGRCQRLFPSLFIMARVRFCGEQ